jgi:hypothetical protein
VKGDVINLTVSKKDEDPDAGVPVDDVLNWYALVSYQGLRGGSVADGVDIWKSLAAAFIEVWLSAEPYYLAELGRAQRLVDSDDLIL